MFTRHALIQPGVRLTTQLMNTARIYLRTSTMTPLAYN